MRRITLAYVFFAVTVVVSCQHIDIKKRIQDDYRQSILFFEDVLVNHFPSELPDSCWYMTTVPKTDTLKRFGFGVDKLIMTNSLSQFKAIASDFKNSSSTTYSANDSSLLLIFDYCNIVEIEGRTFEDQESPERQNLARRNVTTASSLPVPLFEIDEYKGNTMSGLTEDFKLSVLDAKPGKYIDEKHLQECECLPENWKHGYSKGVALSDERQVIIYWLVVW